MPACSRRRAFSLAEVLLATALASTLAVSAAWTVASAQLARRTAAAQLDRLQQLDGWARTGRWLGSGEATFSYADHPAGHLATARLRDADGRILAERTVLRPGTPP